MEVPKQREETFGVMDVFMILIVAMVSNISKIVIPVIPQ